ncbi:MAG: Transcriptional regulatory protein YpdB [Candidatus Omnitrophica bacterium ADurb.Bin292]|nr:MAG: Transcriptional regulatory protein YpdB [Candidatus Omnitrophica bacterium ADurb.Bin292]
MIRVLVVDDEALAREELTRLITRDKEFHVVATASNGEEALKEIKQGTFDAVFLDIDMPKMNGLEVASRLVETEMPPRIVFATAFNQYAIDAFKINAIDYILKPYEPDRVQQSLDRIREVLKTQEFYREKFLALEDTLIRKGMLKKIVGHRRNSKERIVLDPAEILYFHAHLAEVSAYSTAGEFLVRMTLKELVQNLNAAQFAQTHKAYIVNLGQIEKVSPLFSGNFEITLKDPKRTKIPFSRRYASIVKSSLGTW